MWGGVGFAHNTADATEFSVDGITGVLDGDSKTSLAWQLMAGIVVAVTPNWVIDGGYRYLRLGEARTGDTLTTTNGIAFSGATTSFDVQAHEARVRIRYQFYCLTA